MRRKTVALMVGLIGVCLALGACRSEEKGRPLSFESGVYLGAADDKLAEDTLNVLRDRADGQRK